MKLKNLQRILIGISANYLFSIITIAQAPSSFKYQAVLRDASGNIKANTNANVQIDILKDGISGTVVFAETFATQANSYGLINLEIGSGTLVSGNISTIDWSTGPYFIKVSIDGNEMGTSQLLSVPYAMYATKAGNGFSGNYTDLTNKPDLFDGTWTSLTSKPSFASVATSGSYTDLSSKPVNVSTFTNDAGYITAANESDPKIGSNTSNYIPKWDGSKLIAGTILDNGKVGIGVSNPFVSLEVNGSINIPADSCYRIGKTLVLSNKGTNLFVGYNKAVFSASGTHNNCFGQYAGNSLSSGHYNCLIGYQAGYNVTSCIGNVFLGRQSGFNTTASANWNIFIGDQCGYSNTSGYGNNFIGAATAFINTTGSWNTFLGHLAGLSITTGNYNVLIGHHADVGSGNLTNAAAIGNYAIVSASNNMVFGSSDVVGWGFGCSPGTSAIKVGSSASNGNGAGLTKTGIWTNASDSTKKCNIRPIPYGLNEILKLRPVTYQLKDLRVSDIGFLAQEVKLVLPEIVYGKEGEMTLSYGQVTAVLTKAMQEQQKQIEDLKNEVEELKQLLVKLSKR